MRKWILKAVVQKAISYLPGKHRLNYLFQKYVTRGVRLSDAYLDGRLHHLRYHISAGLTHGGGLAGARVLELGAGWYPVVPLGFFLAGAAAVYTVDISRLMSKEKLLVTLRRLNRYLNEEANPHLPVVAERRRRLAELAAHGHAMSFGALLEALHVHYLIADARRLPLADSSIDLICSNNTLEHIYPDVMRDIFREFRRIGRPGSIMSHFIDMSDHFAHLDPGITDYHFLRYSERAWKRIDNSIQPQNRWRITHYRALFRELGIPLLEETPRPGNITALQSIPLAPAFRTIPEADLAISHCYVVGKVEK